MTTDCNWDPLMLSIAPKPEKGNAFFCSYEGTGKLTMFLTGNDMAQKVLAGVKEVFSGTYKKLYFAARPVCLTFETFTQNYAPYWGCSEIQNKTAEFLAKIKPDVMIIAQNMKNNDNFRAPVASVEDAATDIVTKQVSAFFKLWSAYTKKIFIIEPQPTVFVNPAASAAKALADGRSLDTNFIPLQTVQDQIDPGWMRILAAVKTCPKCIAIDMRGTFIEDDKYWYVDQKTNLSYLCDNNRLSPAGVKKMEPVLKDVIGKAIAGL
uniref:SGNH domain-containing protein n=1 Tax=Panagrolaimus davidi TaxID=227884 RepID=A0A914PKM6_9BILA